MHTFQQPNHLARFVVDSVAQFDLSVLYDHYGSRGGEPYSPEVLLSLLIVGCALSNHPNDSQEAEPTLAAIPSEIGTPESAALDAGYFGPATVEACAKRGIEPYIATGRDPHHPSWQQRFAPLSDPPPEDVSS